jgi:hypothetical protein
MSIGTSLALSHDCATDVDTNLDTFALRAADADRSVFSVAGLTYPLEITLDIAHKTDKSGVKRSVIKRTDTRLDSLNVPGTASCAFTIVRPPNTAFTDAVIIQMVNTIVDFLIEGGANANVTKVLNFET